MRPDRLPRAGWALLLALAWPYAAQAQDPGFTPLTADPREPHWSLETRPGFGLFGLDLGGNWDVVRLGQTAFGSMDLGLLGGASLGLERQHWATYRLQSDDWLAGLTLSAAAGDLSWRLEYRHEASDLGDELFDRKTALDYRRQGERFLLSWDVSKAIRAYAGLGYWQFQSFTFPAWETLAGLEASTPAADLAGIPARFYLAYQVGDPGQGQALWNQDLQLGLRLGSAREDRWPVRLYFLYHSGKNTAGQFYREDDSHFGFGMALEP